MLIGEYREETGINRIPKRRKKSRDSQTVRIGRPREEREGEQREEEEREGEEREAEEKERREEGEKKCDQSIYTPQPT